MNHAMEIQPGQCVTDERELKKLLRRADIEAEQRKRTMPIPSSSARTFYSDELQRKLTQMAKEALERTMKTPALGEGKARLLLQDISDEDFIRALIEPTILNLDEGYSSTRTVDSLDDDTFIRSITQPVVLDLRD